MPDNITTHAYDADTPLSEPVEIRMADPFGNAKTLCAWLTDRGTVGHSYGSSNSSSGDALSNLQSVARFPRKAVPGWQAEVVAFAKASRIATITEIR